MFEGYDSVLEIGAGEGFKSRIVSQSVINLTLSDYTNIYKKLYTADKNTKYIIHNFQKQKLNKKYQGIYALDFIEHIQKKNENKFIINILHSLKKKAC